MNIPEQYKTIIATLSRATAEGRVLWTELSKNSAAIAFEQNTLELWSGTDEQTEQPFVAMGLRNSGGELADNFWVDANERDFQELESLYKAALRKARRIDETLARLNAELQKDQIGSPPSKAGTGGKVPSILVGRWNHQWGPDLSRSSLVNIYADGSYVAQEGAVQTKFRAENATYSEATREIKFDLVRVADGRKDSTQILRVEGVNLLEGSVAGDPQNRRRYTRLQ